MKNKVMERERRTDVYNACNEKDSVQGILLGVVMPSTDSATEIINPPFHHSQNTYAICSSGETHLTTSTIPEKKKIRSTSPKPTVSPRTLHPSFRVTPHVAKCRGFTCQREVHPDHLCQHHPYHGNHPVLVLLR